MYKNIIISRGKLNPWSIPKNPCIRCPIRVSVFGKKCRLKDRIWERSICTYSSRSSVIPCCVSDAPRRIIIYSVALNIFPIGNLIYAIRVSVPRAVAAANPARSPIKFCMKAENNETLAVKRAISNPSRSTRNTIVRNNDRSNIFFCIFWWAVIKAVPLPFRITEWREKTT